MNQKRRTKLQKISDSLQEVIDEQQESLDNIPENLLESALAATMEDQIDALQDAQGTIGPIIEM